MFQIYSLFYWIHNYDCFKLRNVYHTKDKFHWHIFVFIMTGQSPHSCLGALFSFSWWEWGVSYPVHSHRRRICVQPIWTAHCNSRHHDRQAQIHLPVQQEHQLRKTVHSDRQRRKQDFIPQGLQQCCEFIYLFVFCRRAFKRHLLISV